MFLFIFESIGTSELILIGIIALIFLGPRKLPEIAKKMGKIMADFRNTTNEFKETWEREVNFEEETKAIRELGNLDDLKESTPRIETPNLEPHGISAPEIKQIDASAFNEAAKAGIAESLVDEIEAAAENVPPNNDSATLSEKKNWL